MKTILGAVITLAMITPAFGGGKDPAPAVPQYNVKSETDFVGTILKVREVPAGEAFAGIHLTIQAKGEPIDVFIGPADFIKLMALPLKAGLKDVGITGSKVKFEGNDLVLARELRIEKTVLSLRDETGFPNWLWGARNGIATGGF
jgi:hypothetical protein